MKIWTHTQNTIEIMEGFGPASSISQFLQNNLMNAQDNGIRGHFRTTGDFKAKAFGLNGRYHLPHNLTLGLYLPVYDMRLRNVCFEDLTPGTSPEDIKVREQLTSRLQEVVNMFDPSLNLGGWSKTGFGDLTLLAEWHRYFPQGKPILKNVSLAARLGVMVPTGVKTDENDILFVPFGCDGSVGMVFGGGIDLTWDMPWFLTFRWGLDIEFIQLFGNTRNRRIKVQQNQTEFLLLAKVPVHKDYGFTQRFNLFLEAYRVWRGLSGRATYQFWKHSEDTLTLCTNEFSNAIANTAQSLQQWTMHQAIFELSYDFQCDVPEWSLFKPQFSVFYKVPFNGERSLLLNTIGATFSLNF